MAWTDPRTWTDGELVTASIMNTHVRDNLNVIGAHAYARKIADESVTSSATLQDDDHLTFAIGANEVWVVQFHLWVNSGAGGFKMQVVVPATASGIQTAIYSTGTFAATTAAAGVDIVSNAATFSNQPVWIHATLSSTSAGNCRLQWAQGASNAAASTIKQYSSMLARRVA